MTYINRHENDIVAEFLRDVATLGRGEIAQHYFTSSPGEPFHRCASQAGGATSHQSYRVLSDGEARENLLLELSVREVKVCNKV